MIHMITTRLEGFSLNTVISGFMEYNNNLIAIAKKRRRVWTKELPGSSRSASGTIHRAAK